MISNLTVKVFILLFILTLLSSCGFIEPKSANEYTVTRKAPLVIPPDMNMTPPGNTSRKESNRALLSNKSDTNFSVEDILIGKIVDKKKYKKQKRSQTISTRRKLLEKLLSMKPSKTIN